MAENYEQPYGLVGSQSFRLFDDAGDIVLGATFAAGDALLSIDDGTPVAFDETQISEVGRGQYLMQYTQAMSLSQHIYLSLIDLTATKVFMDRSVRIQFQDLRFGKRFGLTSGAPTVNNIPTDITAGAGANGLEGRIVEFVGTDLQGRILANTAGVNTVLTITDKSFAPPANTPIIIL